MNYSEKIHQTNPLVVCCIIGSHVYSHILKTGNEKQRRSALRSLELSEQLRGRRHVVGSMQAMFSSGGGLLRTIFNAHNTENLPGTPVRHEGASTGDKAAGEAYDYCGDTYKFYKDIFNRNSVDDRGMRLDSTVHFGESPGGQAGVGYDNAMWNGTQMVYGDGDGDLFNRFTIALDVVGHELTHGVTQNSVAPNGLDYHGQPGALNESVSDCFGSMVKQYLHKQSSKDADWLIGAGLLTKQVNGKALRSMKAPGTAYEDPVLGKDPQPDNMNGYVNTTDDNGGVHINSGIPNHAFYLIATALEGYSWEKAGKVWYTVLTTRAQHNTDFKGFANMTVEVAGTILGTTEQKAFKDGWKSVGVI